MLIAAAKQEEEEEAGGIQKSGKEIYLVFLCARILT